MTSPTEAAQPDSSWTPEQRRLITASLDREIEVLQITTDYAERPKVANARLAMAALEASGVPRALWTPALVTRVRDLLVARLTEAGIAPTEADFVLKLARSGRADRAPERPQSRPRKPASPNGSAPRPSATSRAGRTLLESLIELDGVSVARGPESTLSVHVGGGVPVLTLHPSRVMKHERLKGPTGQPALRLYVAGDPPPGIVMYVANGEVAFPPDVDRGHTELHPGRIRVTVSGMPEGVSYHEMIHDFGKVFDGTNNYDALMARVQMCASFWWGARRAGLSVDHLRPQLDALVERLRSM